MKLLANIFKQVIRSTRRAGPNSGAARGSGGPSIFIGTSAGGGPGDQFLQSLISNLTGMQGPGPAATEAERGQAYKRVLDKLTTQAGPNCLVVLKCGKDGVIAARGEERWKQGIFPVNEVVDTTGAGDTFCAGFLFGYFFPKSFKDTQLSGVELALSIGAASAAVCCEIEGACPSGQGVQISQINEMLLRGKTTTL